MAVPGVPVASAQGLADAEFGVTREQSLAVAETCMGKAAKAMPPAGRAALLSSIAAMSSDLATALDKVKTTRARIKTQKQRLQKEIDTVGGGQGSVSKFYALASPMIANCGVAAQTAEGVKTGSDLVYAGGNELRYRMGLLDTRDSNLSSVETYLTKTREGLDQMTLALERG